MIINSLLPPTSLQSPTTGQWYIVTTDPKLGWVPVDRKYEWEELDKMWRKVTYGTSLVRRAPKKVHIKKAYKVDGSRGNVYKVLNDNGVWNCSCPAYGWGRGKDCKHIKKLKNNC
jgi:hypothetical protein